MLQCDSQGMDPQAVREELERVTGSAEFQNSDRLCRFLRFVVEAKLKGEPAKELVIGREVFDRNGEYDPRIDPIVRVEARRLRKKLADYYGGPGAGNSVRIDLPKGGYAPEFVTGTVAPRNAWPRWWLAVPILVVVAAAAAAAAAVWFGRTPTSDTTVAVLPARWIWKGNDFPDITHDEDVAERICENLARNPRLRVIAWPAVQRHRDGTKTMREVGAELGATRIAVVAVRVESDGLRLTTYLVDTAADRKLNVQDLRAVALRTPEDREKAAASIAADLAHRLY